MLRYLLLNAPHLIPEGHWVRHLKDLSDPRSDIFLSICEALEADGKVGHQSTDTLELFHHAIHQQRTSIVEKLIEQRQPLIHVAAKNWATNWYRPTGLWMGANWTGTPLHLAVLMGEKDVVLRSLESGVNANARTDQFEVDASRGYVFTCPSHGPTALHIALHSNQVYNIPVGDLNEDHLSVARMLLGYGADIAGVGKHLKLNDRPRFRLFEDVWDKVKNT